MSTVVVVSTGGTIAMRPDPETGKLVPAVSGEELVDLLDWPDAPPLELDDFAHVPSFDVHGALALALARRVVEHAEVGRPVVVTHGTDTMEETAYLVDLLLPSQAAPVVFTGAQRGAEQRLHRQPCVPERRPCGGARVTSLARPGSSHAHKFAHWASSPNRRGTVRRDTMRAWPRVTPASYPT